MTNKELRKRLSSIGQSIGNLIIVSRREVAGNYGDSLFLIHTELDEVIDSLSQRCVNCDRLIGDEEKILCDPCAEIVKRHKKWE